MLHGSFTPPEHAKISLLKCLRLISRFLKDFLRNTRCIIWSLNTCNFNKNNFSYSYFVSRYTCNSSANHSHSPTNLVTSFCENPVCTKSSRTSKVSSKLHKLMKYFVIMCFLESCVGEWYDKFKAVTAKSTELFILGSEYLLYINAYAFRCVIIRI